MRKFTKSLLTLALLVISVGSVKAEKVSLSFSCAEYCHATWNSGTKTFTWGVAPTADWAAGNTDWVFMAASGISGDLSEYTKFHINAKNFTNASAQELTIVFKKNDGTNPPSGPTKEFKLSPDANGDITIDLTSVAWGDCDITKIQDLTIYGCARDDDSAPASVVVTDAYLEKPDVVLTDDITLIPTAGWNTTVDVGVLTGNVAFNYINAYANVNLISTPVDLSEYPSYELVLADDAPVGKIQFCINYDTATETDKTTWSGISTTTPAAVIPAGAIKLNSIGVQACNIANLGRVEIKSFNLIDGSSNKTPTIYETPASWAATVIVEKGTMTFTTGGQWNFGSMNGAAGVKLPATITINADALPANVHLNVGTSLVTGKNGDEDVYRHEYQGWTAGDKTVVFTIQPKGVNETIETIELQNTVADNACSIANLNGKVTPATKTSVAVGEAGFVTYSYFRDVTLAGVTGYKAKYESGSVKLTPVTEVTAGNGVIIEASAGNHDLDFNVSTTDFSDNELKVSDGNVEGDGTIYVLANKNNVLGFYKLTNGEKVPAGKAYLKITSPAPEFVAIDGMGFTSINEVKAAKANNEFFNLAGQRVAQPAKGLYIVNGKKVIFK